MNLNRHRVLDTLTPPGCIQNLTSNYALAVLADHPVGYWQMQECYGDLADSSSAGKTMFRTASSLQAYRSSTPLTATDTYSIETAGGTLYGTSTIPTTAVNNCSMELWIKHIPPTGIGTNQEILYNGQSQFNGWGLVMQPTRSLQLLRGNIAITGGSTPLADNTWTHVAMVRDAGTWKLYLNGTIDAGAGFGSGGPNTPAVGAFTGGNTIQRQTCHMAIYDTALSASQVATHYGAR